MEELLSSYFHLSQNSPYLFKDNTKIRYSLPLKTNVCLTVFNSKGKVIKKLVNKIQEAGMYEINFNRNFFPGGDYFCQLQAGDPSASSPEGQAGRGFQQIMKVVILN